jgi:hypothetical protein
MCTNQLKAARRNANIRIRCFVRSSKRERHGTQSSLTKLMNTEVCQVVYGQKVMYDIKVLFLRK